MTPKNQHGTWSRAPVSDYMFVFQEVSAGTSNPLTFERSKKPSAPQNVHQPKKTPTNIFLEKKNPPLFQLPNVIPVFLSTKLSH